MDKFPTTSILETMGLGIKAPDYFKMLPDIPAFSNPLVTYTQKNLASEFYRRLTKWIADFDAHLDPEHEVGVRLVTFGTAEVFHLQDLRYWNPSLLCFIGVRDDGSPVQLIQHVSQISVLLMKLPRKDLSQPKPKFGFVQESDEDEASEE
jgi:hypothetical protein